MDQNLGIIGGPYNTMSRSFIVRQYADKERKITLLHTDEICPVISAADTKWYGMLQLSHKPVLCKRHRILHLFSTECVLLNEIKRSLAVYCSLTSFEFRSEITTILHPFIQWAVHSPQAIPPWRHTSSNGWPCWEFNLWSYQHWRQAPSDKLHWTQNHMH